MNPSIGFQQTSKRCAARRPIVWSYCQATLILYPLRNLYLTPLPACLDVIGFCRLFPSRFCFYLRLAIGSRSKSVFANLDRIKPLFRFSRNR